MIGPFLGVVLHAIGGFAAGSFYIPFKKVRSWAWESYWLIQGVLAWIVAPWVAAALTTPDLWGVLSGCPPKSLLTAYVFGVLWGIGGLTFGLSMRYLGMSLGYATALGFCAAVGTLVPPLMHDDFPAAFADWLWSGGFGTSTFPTFLDVEFPGNLTSFSGLIVLAGVAVCLMGITLCGYAGIRKEGELTEEQTKETIQEFSLVKGFAVAVFAGVMSACMAFAIDAGKPIADAAVAAGAADIFQNNAVFIVVMAGGFTTNVLWCLLLNLKNRSIGDYTKGAPRELASNYLFAGLAGVIWYGQFFFYGMGTTRMGEYDFSSWTIHMAFIIVFSNLWAIRFHEWKGVGRSTMRLVWAGIGVLILSTVVIGAGNYLAPKPEPQSVQSRPEIGIDSSLAPSADD